MKWSIADVRLQNLEQGELSIRDKLDALAAVDDIIEGKLVSMRANNSAQAAQISYLHFRWV